MENILLGVSMTFLHSVSQDSANEQLWSLFMIHCRDIH